ncbi:MAG: HAD family hydrolase [Candidatus Obscuribacterales bacterium]|nr:HAD family hydrolase [Candidatus Obscuribacterales bacterium]
MAKNRKRKRRHTVVQRMVEAVKEHRIELVATDGDGTMYPFWDYFVPAMQKFVPQMAKVIGMNDLDLLSREMGRVMARYGTHEHPWTLEETLMRKQFQGTAVEFRQQVVAPFWSALDRYRTKYLRLYHDVRETLQALHDAGIPVVLVSDAPAHMAVVRATQTGVDELIAGCYALETEEPNADAGLTDEDLAYGRERVRDFANTPHRFKVFRTMPKSHEKPSPLGLQMAMKDCGITDPSKVLFTGDSLKKDGGVAKAVGSLFVWARYGTNLPGGYKELIDVKFNPDAKSGPSTSSHGVSYMPEVLPPMVAQAASFAELLRHLVRARQGSSGTILTASATPSATKAVGH